MGSIASSLIFGLFTDTNPEIPMLTTGITLVIVTWAVDGGVRGGIGGRIRSRVGGVGRRVGGGVGSGLYFFQHFSALHHATHAA